MSRSGLLHREITLSRILCSFQIFLSAITSFTFAFYDHSSLEKFALGGLSRKVPIYWAHSDPRCVTLGSGGVRGLLLNPHSMRSSPHSIHQRLTIRSSRLQLTPKRFSISSSILSSISPQFSAIISTQASFWNTNVSPPHHTSNLPPPSPLLYSLHSQ